MLSNGPPLHLRNGSASGNGVSRDPPFRHMSTGSLNIPNGLGTQNAAGNGQPQMMSTAASGPRLDGPRSPPNKQNTSHVPCKFFRQGACQAGKACPFSHDLAATVDNVCKYFAKGNCKFGPKCANAHILPNGQRVNYHKGGPIVVGGGNLNLGGRVNPDPYLAQSSALTNSLYRANMSATSPFGAPYTGFHNQEDFPTLGHRASMEIGIPTIDTSYASHPGSAYGSPRDDDNNNRFGVGLSPVPTNGLSILDAPLPASFDSNGVSWIARNGPIAASVPSKFGLESPPASLSLAKEGRTSEALKILHSSAFGDDTRDRFNGVAASPPTAPAEEYFGKRVMHSQRFAKQKIMSASLPKSGLAIDKDWDADFTFEEDYIPDNLKDLLTPAEKARRGSRHAEEEARPIYSGTGTPTESTSKYGSPSNASPSRWSPFFQRQREDEEKSSSRNPTFGHVGSPLRNSSLHPGSSPNLRPISRPTTGGSGDASPYFASPPRQSSMSIISQQLQRTRLGRAESSGSESGLYPAVASRITSNPVGTGVKRTDMDRQVSSSSIGTARFTTPIDEEQGEFVFRMEEEEGQEREREKEKRNSGNGWGYRAGSGAGAKSPHLGAIGGRSTNGSNGISTDENIRGMEGMFGVGP